MKLNFHKVLSGGWFLYAMFVLVMEEPDPHSFWSAIVLSGIFLASDPDFRL